MVAEIDKYLNTRISRKNYRGMHVVQHNRLPDDKLVGLLEAIHEVVGVNEFTIPPGDDPNPKWIHTGRRLTAGDYRDYYAILDAISVCGIPGVSATFNSLKKNHFPNFEILGLLSRQNSGRGASGQSTAHLTQSAVEILHAGATRQRTKLIGEAVEKSLGDEFIEEIHTLLTELDLLNVYEMMLIVTDRELSLATKVMLIRSYRRLKALGRLQLHATLRAKMDPTMSLAKVDKRDWSNWRNESQQIVSMLSSVAGFKVYENNLVMLAGAAGAAIFSPERSARVKQESLDWNSNGRREDWELHHIYPIEYATCDNDMKLIDAKENLLYIPASLHAKIPSRQNLSVKFTYDSTHVVLLNPTVANGVPKLFLTIPIEVAVKNSNLQVMADYSERLLASVS